MHLPAFGSHLPAYFHRFFRPIPAYFEQTTPFFLIFLSGCGDLFHAFTFKM
jgi:hypothetical protein